MRMTNAPHMSNTTQTKDMWVTGDEQRTTYFSANVTSEQNTAVPQNHFMNENS